MSTTPDVSTVAPTAGSIIAAALINEASQSTEHRRMYLGGIWGLEPEAIFEALALHMSPEATVTVPSARGEVTLDGIEASQPGARNAITLVPYLVGRATARNRGSAGFAAVLRDEVPSGDGVKVLLLLDREPLETVRTASEDAAGLPALSWPKLVLETARAARPATRPLLEAIAADHARLPHQAEILTELGRMSSLDSTASVGRQLSRLRVYVNDPEIEPNPEKRLRESAAWRDKLGTWSAPDKDFESLLKAAYPDPDDRGAEQVLAARGPFGLDYTRFTRADLPANRPRGRLQFAQPLRARGAAYASSGRCIAAWLPRGSALSIVMTGAARSSDRARVRWSSGEVSDLDLEADSREVRVRVPRSGGVDGWHFGEIALQSGEPIAIAITTHDGAWFPVEADVDVDVQAAAFRSSESPRVLCVDHRNVVVGSASLGGGSDRGDGVTVYMAGRGPASHPIPLLALATGEGGETGGDPGGDGAPEVPDAGGDEPSDTPDDEGGSATSGGGAAPGSIVGEPVRCVPLALLDASRHGTVDEEPVFSIADGTGWVTAASLRELESQQLASSVGDTSPLDGLAIERWILEHPELTAFAAELDGSTTVVSRDAPLDRLTLDALAPKPVAQFWAARREFFAALVPHGSVHALGAGVATREAERYVEAYGALLGSLDSSGPFLAEYERLLLCDAVTDVASDDILLAPTNPVTVAWLTGLSTVIEGWLPRAGEVLPADLASLSPRHLLPIFARGTLWYESVDAGPLLWRRYAASTGATARAEHQHGYIARRIEHFLRVYPHYLEPRQVLALTFIEPGEGEPVLEALRALFEQRLDGDGVHLPQLSITIVTGSKRVGALERMLSGTASVPLRQRAADIDRAMRDRIKVTVVAPGSELPFAHLSFVFRSPLQRAPGVVDLDGRSSTLWASGLAASPGRHVQPGRNETSFAWGTFTGQSPMGDLPTLVHRTLEVVGGMPREHLASGKTRMPSTRVSSAFLTGVYGASIWVVHLDRLLGLEAFAPSAVGEHARYLIDYEDRADPAQPGLDAITATELVQPYRKALRRALSGLGDPTDPALDRLLRRFNSVSGRWALDIVGAHINDLHERVGLAAAIAACDELDAAFAGDGWCGVMVPVKEMLDSLPRELRRPAGQHSDDLLYLRIHLDRRPVLISGRLLEVKYRAGTDGASSRAARTQLETTHSWLDATFNGDGPGRPFRSRDLAELIRGSVTRGESFELLAVPDRPALESALDAISTGSFHLDLSYRVGGTVLQGDFISIEGDSSVAAHRQQLDGPGASLGHVRLGRPVLESLATGRPLPRPPRWEPARMPGASPGDGTPGEGNGNGGGPRPSTQDRDAEPSASPQDPIGGRQDPARPEAGDGNASAEVATLSPRLDAAFARYGLAVEPFDPSLVQVGPSLIRFRTRALGKLSIGDVERRARDITREVGSTGQVSVGDEPGFVTVDVPRAARASVPLQAVLPELDRAMGKPGALSFVVGVSPSGAVRVADLTRLPHLLVAGATGSGKSVFLRGLLVELLRVRTPDELGLVIVDPKRLDFAAFARSPHLRGNRIIHSADEALETLRDTLEMELAWRQPILEDAGVSSASEYYETGGRLDDLPQLVIMVDEFADLVLSGSDRRAFSEMIQRYAQLTRAYGIFLVLATQRPSVDVITGSIKANLTARIAFSLPSSRDSMTVLDRPGAQDLLGDGDLLFYSNGRVERLQAPFTSAADVKRVIADGSDGSAP